MEILPLSFYENLKRFLQRRNYQRLKSPYPSSSPTRNRKKLKISKLGGCRRNSTRQLWRIRRAPRLQCKSVSGAIKSLVRIHDVYVDLMVCVAEKVVTPNGIGGRKAAKARQFALVSSEEVVDCRLVMEMYKKLAASRQLSSFDELI